MQILVHVHVHVKPEFVEAFKAASGENARQSVLEPGVASFDVFQQADDSTRFLLIECFRSPEGREAHRETRHYQAWRDAVAEMMAEPRRGVVYERI